MIPKCILLNDIEFEKAAKKVIATKNINSEKTIALQAPKLDL